MTIRRFTPLSPLADSGPVAPIRNRPIPRFKFIAPRAVRGGLGIIAIGDTVFHSISNIAAFYAALGFNPGVNDGLPPEEFIWERYTRDGASKSPSCMQVQIATYLHTHSAEFVKLYGRAYDAVIGKCDSAEIDDADEHCLNCPMHPPADG